jgi:2Fe-2S ferredoxin
MLESALSQNQPIDYKCRKGNCGKCKVRVIEGSEWLSSPTSKEVIKLKNELTEGYRFACQTMIF